MRERILVLLLVTLALGSSCSAPVEESEEFQKIQNELEVALTQANEAKREAEEVSGDLLGANIKADLNQITADQERERANNFAKRYQCLRDEIAKVDGTLTALGEAEFAEDPNNNDFVMLLLLDELFDLVQNANDC